MPLLDLYRAVRDASHDQRNAHQANQSKLGIRLLDVLLRTWDLGFTAFGGPPVHFHIIRERFVEGQGGKTPWLDERTYQELFALCQALPGPASTKLLFCTVLIHAGFLPAVFVFFLWSLPAALVMFCLSIGVQQMNEILPDPVYALLSGLNASTVGIIALAAVQLAEKAITDRITRVIVIFGACAGVCYNALWYFPILMIIGGLTTVLWDGWLRQGVAKVRKNVQKKRQDAHVLVEENTSEPSTADVELVAFDNAPEAENTVTHRASSRKVQSSSPVHTSPDQRNEQSNRVEVATADSQNTTREADTITHGVSVVVGITIIILFFARSTADPSPRLLDLFANMYLAGTVIFGGGPVVIPLLREYVVETGWVSSRNFLLGLAIIQALPGPNFNFAVFLGALAVQGTAHPSILGALLAYIGIFVPGLTLSVGAQSLWRLLRKRPVVTSLLRGINAAAVGLVFTAVYRLWEIGYLMKEMSSGQSLARNPWWVVVAAVAYSATAWFRVPAAIAIVFGAVLGLCWYGAVGR